METALVTRLDELWCEWVEGSASIFALFDLSAFNTTNHGSLLDRINSGQHVVMLVCLHSSGPISVGVDSGGQVLLSAPTM